MNVTDEMMDMAFADFLSRFQRDAASTMNTQEISEYIEQATKYYMEDYRHSTSAETRGNNDFFEISSRSRYIGYPGDNQLRIYLPPAASDEQLGESLNQALAQSRIMTYEYLTNVSPGLNRDQGMTRYKNHLEDLMKKYNYKTKRALFKSMKFVIAEKNGRDNKMVFHPTKQETLDGFRGLSQEFVVTIDASSHVTDVGAALRLAVTRCT